MYLNLNISIFLYLIQLSLLYLYKNTKFDNKVSALITLFYSLLLSLSASYLGEKSNDYFVYLDDYVANDGMRFEFGYRFLREFSSDIGFDFQEFYFLCNFFTIFIIVFTSNCIIRKSGIYNIFIFQLFYFSALYINLNFIILRTALALSFFLIYFYYHLEKNNIRFLYALLALSMHFMIVPILILVELSKFINLRNINSFKNIIFTLLLLSIISYLMASQLSDLYREIIGNYLSRYVMYINPNEKWFEYYNKIPTTQLVIFFTLIIEFIYFNNFSINNNLDLTKFIIISFLIIILVPFYNINSRFYIYILPFYFIYLSIIFNIFKKAKELIYILLTFPYFITNFYK